MLSPSPLRSTRTNLLGHSLLALCLGLLGLGLPGLEAPAAAQVPTFSEVTGHAFGERITLHHQMVAYLRALESASDRVRVIDQGASWEGRALLVAIVTSPANHARLEAIQQGAQQLDDPRGLSASDADTLLERQPAVVWLGGSIHGFELSGTEGVLKLLQDLTTLDDEATLQVLDQTVVLIDPMLNPDGRDAFAHWNVGRNGRSPNPSRQDWNNDADGWNALRFRTGHYYFDNNRDWFAHTQAEARARWPTIRAWRPQVVVDAHEMSSDVEFYFDPPAEPYGALFPSFAKKWFEQFSAAYAKAFDARGFEYMTAERFNYLYPGYTTSWGSYQGAVGMLYEQGSSRGLAITRPDDSVRTLADALEQQYTAARAAVDLAAARRRELLSDYLASQRRAVAPTVVERYYLSPEGADPGHFAELIALLSRNGIEVRALTEAVEVDATAVGPAAHSAPHPDAEQPDAKEPKTKHSESTRSETKWRLPAGTAVIDTAQPRGVLARTLLDPDLPLPAGFLREARVRLDRGENPRFYDITSWHLPLLFGVRSYHGQAGATLGEAVASESGAPESGAPASEATLPARADYAYLIDGRDARSLTAVARLREQGHRVSVLLAESEVEGARVARGTAVVRVGQNDASVHEAVRALADELGVAVRGVATGAASAGLPALGSGDAIPVRGVRVALLAEAPVQAYSFGWAWYVLDQQYRIPVTVLRSRSLGETPLETYDTLVVPDVTDAEALASRLSEAGLARLRQWIEDGGTLVLLARAVDFARHHLELDLRDWYETAEEREDAPVPQRVPVDGVIARAGLDADAWLTAGHGFESLSVLVNSSRLYLPPEGPPNPAKRVVARYEEGEALRLSGHLWKETHERLPGAVAVYEELRGNGRIVAFAEDPNFRGYWRGIDRLFLNAVVLGASAP